MTDKALTVQEQHALEVRARRELDDLLKDDPNLLKMLSHADLDEGDLAQPPNLKLAQDDDDELGVKAGEYYNTLTGQVYGKSVEVVPLINLTKTRAEYFRPYTKGEPPLCASDDARMPRKSTDRRPLTDPKPGPCSSCPQASWDNGTPLCSEQSNFMVATMGEWDKLRIMWQRTGVPTAKRLRSIMAESGILKPVTISAVYNKTEKGNYWTPTVTAGKRLTTAELVYAARTKQEADNMIKEGMWHIVAEDVADFDESNGYATAASAEPVEDEDIPF